MPKRLLAYFAPSMMTMLPRQLLTHVAILLAGQWLALLQQTSFKQLHHRRHCGQSHSHPHQEQEQQQQQRRIVLQQLQQLLLLQQRQNQHPCH